MSSQDKKTQLGESLWRGKPLKEYTREELMEIIAEINGFWLMEKEERKKLIESL